MNAYAKRLIRISEHPVMIIAMSPTKIPVICVLLSFSEKKSFPVMVDKITIAPFETGKNTALGIIAESERLSLIYMQLTSPQRKM